MNDDQIKAILKVGQERPWSAISPEELTALVTECLKRGEVIEQLREVALIACHMTRRNSCELTGYTHCPKCVEDCKFGAALDAAGRGK